MRGAESPMSRDGCRGQFPNTGDTEVGLRPIVPTEPILRRQPTLDWSFCVAGPRERRFVREGGQQKKIAAAAKEKQPGEFRRWGRNHKNSASGCHPHFTAEGAGLQTSGKPGLECAGCIWNSLTKMRRQLPRMAVPPRRKRRRDKSDISRAHARVAELADAPDLGSGAARRGGSSPPSRIPPQLPL